MMSLAEDEREKENKEGNEGGVYSKERQRGERGGQDLNEK
jgi:hypothetical protein